MKTHLVIPHYNDTARLESFLDAMQRGLPERFSILVSDDGSTPQEREHLATLIRAVQPVYFTKLGVRPGPWHGGPQDARVQSIVEIRARAGYAVNGLSSQVSSGFDNTQFSFAKVTRLGLDPQRTYQSEVIGLPRKPVAPFVSISGNQPIIGITGHADNILYGLGLIATK